MNYQYCMYILKVGQGQQKVGQIIVLQGNDRESLDAYNVRIW